MKFFFPDSHDLVDPSFDFSTERRSQHRIRHQDDQYAHELFNESPYSGILVSKAIVDGTEKGAGKYTTAQRQRLLRLGVREFFRFGPRPLETMGDCGAFSYVREKTPPYSVDDVITLYRFLFVTADARNGRKLRQELPVHSEVVNDTRAPLPYF